MVVHKALRGKNGYRMWNSQHLLRSLVGLPVPPKAFIHPEIRDALLEEAARKGSGKVGPSSVEVVEDDVVDEVMAGRRVFDPDIYYNCDGITAEEVALEGDESVYSFGTAEDLWFLLVNEASWTTLIVGEIVLEASMILFCGVLLTIVAALEGVDHAETLGSKVLLSLTTVRLSTDSIYGWQQGKPSSTTEIAVLALFGWIHWLILSVAAALIVARALRPPTSGLFSPDMVVNESGAQVRFMVLRNQLQTKLGFLYNLEFHMQGMTAGGQTVDMALLRSKYAMWLNQNNIITLRHDISHPDSPYCPTREGGPLTMSTVFVTLTALDCDGNSVLESIIYSDPTNMSPSTEAKFRPFPRILHNHKFEDMYRMVRHPETGELVKTTPQFVCNLDNFIKVVPLKPGEAGYTIGASNK